MVSFTGLCILHDVVLIGLSPLSDITHKLEDNFDFLIRLKPQLFEVSFLATKEDQNFFKIIFITYTRQRYQQSEKFLWSWAYQALVNNRISLVLCLTYIYTTFGSYDSFVFLYQTWARLPTIHKLFRSDPSSPYPSLPTTDAGGWFSHLYQWLASCRQAFPNR